MGRGAGKIGQPRRRQPPTRPRQLTLSVCTGTQHQHRIIGGNIPLGLLIGGVDFGDLAITLKAAQGDAPAVVLAYGKFIQSIIDFVIVAFAIFMGVKAINRLKREEAAAPSLPPVPTKEEELLGEIRDLLKAQNNKPL